jgi:hypothetical protein
MHEQQILIACTNKPTPLDCELSSKKGSQEARKAYRKPEKHIIIRSIIAKSFINSSLHNEDMGEMD